VQEAPEVFVPGLFVVINQSFEFFVLDGSAHGENKSTLFAVGGDSNPKGKRRGDDPVRIDEKRWIGQRAASPSSPVLVAVPKFPMAKSLILL
jgi:hypothetical protein